MGVKERYIPLAELIYLLPHYRKRVVDDICEWPGKFELKRGQTISNLNGYLCNLPPGICDA
jgi:hypothetical protein